MTAPRRLHPVPTPVPTPGSRPVSTAGTAPADEPLWRQVLGAELRRTRQHRSETLGETAARAGVSPQYLSEIERGLKDPSSEMVAAVAGALDLEVRTLMAAASRSLLSHPAPHARGATRGTGGQVLALAA